MEPNQSHSTSKASSLRWQILRRALLRRPSNSGNPNEKFILDKVSRRTRSGFNLIPWHVVNEAEEDSDSLTKGDVCFCYTLPLPNAPKLFLCQRWEDCVDLNDFEVCNRYDIDNTGLVFKFSRIQNSDKESSPEQTHLSGSNFLCSVDYHDLTDLLLFREHLPCDLFQFQTPLRIWWNLRVSRFLHPRQWPSEDVLAYYSTTHIDSFRNKRVIELGSGYGLAGLVIATVTEALEVVISDGNPQVVDYIQRNIDTNSAAFGSTKVKSMILHWDQHEVSEISGTFDIIVASDCTFFKKFHKGLARTIRCLLKEHGPSEAILISPKRGDSLDKFMVEVKDSRLHFTITETYDTKIWRRHNDIINGDHSWPNYESDHCYPLLIRITR